MTIRQRSDLRPYQRRAVERIVKSPRHAVFPDMGMGKTAIALTAISDLFDEFYCVRCLVVAPLKVCRTVWAQEAALWAHLQGLTFGYALGTPAQRRKAMMGTDKIVMINKENVHWADENGYMRRFDALIIDESYCIHDPSTRIFKAIRRNIKQFRVRLVLSGAPVANGLLGLWSQIFALDRGERLGKAQRHYHQAYFNHKDIHVGGGRTVRQLSPMDDAEERIHRRIGDITTRLEGADYLDLPRITISTAAVEMSSKAKARYETLERLELKKLEGMEDEVPKNVIAKLGGLRQACNGFFYAWDDDKRVADRFCSEKALALKEMVESEPDERFFVAYLFQEDARHLLETVPGAVMLSKDAREIEAWNRGEIRVLLGHPASASQGLNAQQGGRIAVWYGLPWSLEQYKQFNARLHRPGQTRPVRIIHLVTTGTVEDDVSKSLVIKNASQQRFLGMLAKDLARRCR